MSDSAQNSTKSAQNSAQDVFYTTFSAAKALKRTPACIRRHRYVTKLFSGIGTVVGRTLLFSQSDVEEMAKILRGLGRKAVPKEITH